MQGSVTPCWYWAKALMNIQLNPNIVPPLVHHNLWLYIKSNSKSKYCMMGNSCSHIFMATNWGQDYIKRCWNGGGGPYIRCWLYITLFYSQKNTLIGIHRPKYNPATLDEILQYTSNWQYSGTYSNISAARLFLNKYWSCKPFISHIPWNIMRRTRVSVLPFV